MVLPLAIMAGMAVAGGIANKIGADKEGKRRRRAIRRAQDESTAVNNDQIQNSADMGRQEQVALLDHLRRIGGGSVADAGAASALRRSAIQTRAPVVAPDASADPVTQAAFQRMQGFNATDNAADDSMALMRGLQRADSVSGRRANTAIKGGQVPYMTRSAQNKLRRMQIEAQLERELGTVGNATANLQLLGSFMNTGAGVAAGFAGRP